MQRWVFGHPRRASLSHMTCYDDRASQILHNGRSINYRAPFKTRVLVFGNFASSAGPNLTLSPRVSEG